MRYLGGKSRLGARIVQAILNDLGVKRLSLAVDLCSGAGGVTHRLADVSDKVIAVEAHPGLVALHKAVQGGWVPPEHVSEEEYQAARRSDPADPRVAFIGFGCSFGGKWWGGYSRGTKRAAPRGFAYAASRSLVKRARSTVEHTIGDALTWECEGAGAEIVYCDPPYAGTTGYTAVGVVDANAFWLRLAALASEGRACYLSEYADAPPTGIEARLVWTAPVNGSQLADASSVERLWRVLGFVQEWDSWLEREEVA